MPLILAEIRKGNQAVFERFFLKNYASLVHYAYGYLFDRQASEDIAQEVFLYVWENANNIHVKKSLKGYVLAMVRNRCLNYLKTVKITDRDNFIELNINLTTEYADILKEEEENIRTSYHQVLKIIDILPEKMKEIVKLKLIYGYKYSEIAEELNISINTVKTQLKRAKLKITQMVVVLIILMQQNL